MDAAPPADPWAFIFTATIHELPARLIPALSALDSQLLVARHIIARLRTEQDEADSVKLLLNLISSHVSSHRSLIEELLELLSTCTNHHTLYIECISRFVETTSEASIVLERFRDLITTDRQLTVPAIGALGDFPLTDAQKRLVLEMTLEAVAVVEGDDVPAVVRTLMASMTKDTCKTIVATIRSKTADVAGQKNASLLLEIVLNALRLHPYAARHLLQQITASSTPLSKLDVLLLIGLIDRAANRALVERALVAAAQANTLTLELLRASLADHDLILPMLPSVLSLLRCLLHAASATAPQILEWTMQLYATFFATYERHSIEALSSLLSAFVATSEAGASPPRHALTAARVLLALLGALPSVLVQYMHLFEEVLYDSAPSLHIELLHPLCHLLASLSAFKEPGTHNSLHIFVHKALFAGARLQQRAGLVLASHLLQRGALSAATAAQLVESVMRVIPASESHPVALLHLFDVVLYNIPLIPPSLTGAIFTLHLYPLLAKAAILRNADDVFHVAAHGSRPLSLNSADSRREPAIAALNLAKQSVVVLGGSAAHSHPLYHALLLRAVCALHASMRPQEALATLGRIIALPIEAGALCDDLAKAYAGTGAADTQSLDEKDEDAVWAAYHSFSTLITVMLLLHERGAQPTLAATLQVMSYRSALHTALAALSKRMQGGSSSLGTHERTFKSLPVYADSLLSTPLLTALLTVAMDAPRSLSAVCAAADLAAIMAQRTRSALLPSLTDAPSSLGAPFTLASCAIALSAPFSHELLAHLTHVRPYDRIAKQAALSVETRKSISKAKGTGDEGKAKQLYAADLRLMANQLATVLAALSSTHPSSAYRTQIAATLVAATSEGGADPRDRVYERSVKLLHSVDDQALALLLLQILVCLTQGARKARSVGSLAHAMLARVFLSSDPCVLADVLPLPLDLPGAFAKHPLRLRRGVTALEASSLFARYCVRAYTLMRGDALVAALCEVAGAAQALLEAGLPAHPHLRLLDDATLPPVLLALFDVAAPLMERAAPSVAHVTPYAALLVALRALSRALRVFLAFAKSQTVTAAVAAHVSAELALTLPVAQRQLQECVRWRASFPQQSVAADLEPRLALAHLAAPFGAAHSCVALARQVCKLLKTPAKGRPPASLPRAIQRTEAFFGFLESAARTHHVRPDDTDDDFARAAASKGDDGTDSSRGADLWQAEGREGDDEGAESSGPGADNSTDAPDAEEEEEGDADDDSASDGGFRLVTRKRKGAPGAAKPAAAAHQEEGAGEEEEAYTIVVKPKARKAPPEKAK